MGSTHDCPLCTDTYEKESDLRVHLEVEHRKSELSKRLVELHRTADPVAADERRGSETDGATPRI